MRHGSIAQYTCRVQLLGVVLFALGCTQAADQVSQQPDQFDQDREFDIELPAASEARPLIAQPQKVFINITEDGRIFSGGEAYSLEELAEHLADLKEGQTSLSAIIRADKDCRFRDVVEVINVCNRAGVSHSLMTDESEGR